MALTVKNPPVIQEPQVQTLGWEDPLEEGMATDSNILAWRIPWTQEPGGLCPWGRKESDRTEPLHAHTQAFVAACRLSRGREKELLPSHGGQAAHCSGCFCCAVQALDVQASVVAAHGLSLSTACGILPKQEANHFHCIGRQTPIHRATREVHGIWNF